MRSVYRLLLAAFLAVLLPTLAGCGTSAVRDTPENTPRHNEKPESEPPNVELTPSLLYQLLVAEFAGQQGAMRLSASTYYEVALESRDYRLARRATRLAIYARENAIALKAARLWVELDPDNDESHKSVAALLVASGKLAEARPHLEKLQQSEHQDNNHGYMLIATILASSPDKEQALATMNQLLESVSDSPEAYYAHAHLASQLGDNESARAVLDKLLQLDPKHSQGLILQARVLHELGETEASLQSMDQALQITPDNHQLRLTYARMLVDARKLKQAREQFIRLSKATPHDADVIYALGILAQEAGDLNDAEKHFTKLLHQQQREEESRYALAQIAEARKQYDKAIEWFSSIAQGERYLEAQLQAARLIAQQKGLSEGRKYLRELETQSDGERVQLYLAEAELLSNAKAYQEAFNVYNEGLQRYKDDTALLYARGLIAEKLNRLDITEHDFKRLIELNPKDVHALNALGYTLIDRTERYQEGYAYIERAYRLDPDEVAILDSMGWALYRMGRLDEALDFLKRAAAKLRDGEIAAHLGEVLWVSGQQEAARHVWEEASKFAPNHEVLQKTIQRFNP